MNASTTSTTSYAEMLKLVNTGVFDVDQINELVRRLVARRDSIGQYMKAGFMIGDKVYFNSNKLDRRVEGTIKKIKQKNIEIACGAAGNWNVPATMVRFVD